MGLVGWIFYIVMGILFYFVLYYIENKYIISKLEKMVLSLILMLVVAGFTSNFMISYIDDIFIILVFLFVTDILFTSYFLDIDFFDKNEENIKYYIILILLGFIVNQEFINVVDQVFLTGEDLRIILWSLSIIFLYNFCKNKGIFTHRRIDKNRFISEENVLINYTKLRYQYHDVCNYPEEDITNILYSIMIYQNNKRSKLLRQFDYFKFRLNGKKRALGIMQIESGKFISDIESIELAYKKVKKLFENDKGKSNSKTKKKTISVDEVIKKYESKDYEYIMYIFNIISKF